MRKSACLLGFLVYLCVSIPIFAIEKGKIKSLDTGENPYGPIIEAPKVARVRIPIKLTHFEEVLIQSQQGTKRIEAKALRPVLYNLRATINRTNHFYLTDWHIETVPMKWDRELGEWLVELKFYKRYGEESELEEYVGVLPLSGRLIGKEDIMTLDAKGIQKFTNKKGTPLLLVEAGKILNQDKGNVAKRTTK
jgi:hypothetical protein